MKRKASKTKSGIILLGWREWVAFPDLRVRNIKAKLDTGARTSSLHAFRMHRYVSDGQEMVRFEVHPVQRSRASSVEVEARVLEERKIRNSGGGVEVRPVIETMLELAGRQWPIELTLTRRDEMGFRLLLGRQALRGRVAVDSGASFRAKHVKWQKPEAPNGPQVRRPARSQEEE
ncbi:MAG: RimK/LysX family protein [Gemmatimonadota bacterium]|nr:RimK/LysX family protein [Gemmatimonadota bacterium]